MSSSLTVDPLCSTREFKAPLIASPTQKNSYLKTGVFCSISFTSLSKWFTVKTYIFRIYHIRFVTVHYCNMALYSVCIASHQFCVTFTFFFSCSISIRFNTRARRAHEQAQKMHASIKRKAEHEECRGNLNTGMSDERNGRWMSIPLYLS